MHPNRKSPWNGMPICRERCKTFLTFRPNANWCKTPFLIQCTFDFYICVAKLVREYNVACVGTEASMVFLSCCSQISMSFCDEYCIGFSCTVLIGSSGFFRASSIYSCLTSFGLFWSLEHLFTTVLTRLTQEEALKILNTKSPGEAFKIFTEVPVQSILHSGN